MNEQTKLLRQVNPGFVQNGRVSSQAFHPTPKDEEKLSVYDGDLISPSEAYEHFTQNHSSEGVMAVTVEECSQQELPAAPDPEPFPEHAVIDFSGFSKSQIKKKAKALRLNAENRDWLYQDTSSSTYTE